MKRKNGTKERRPAPAITAFIERKRGDVFDNYALPPQERARTEEYFARLERAGRDCDSFGEFRDLFYHRTFSQDLYRMLSEFIVYYRPPEARETHTNNTLL